jgi:hypothetical protein
MRFGAFFVALLAGCASGPDGTPLKPLRDFRGIIHCHSKYSHDSKGTYEEILAAAKAAKVDFVCITDHPPEGDPGLSLREGWTGLHDGVLFIQGHELAGANLLALGIREPVEGESPAAKIDHIRRQGGVAIVSHPEEVTVWEPYLGADGMEIYNVHAAFTKLRKDPAKLAAALKAVKEDPEHSFMHVQELDPAVVAKWDEINQSRRFVGIAGNDSHQNVNILGLQLDPYPRAFRFVTTHVLAEELTRESILNALRLGRAYVKFEISSRQDLNPDGLQWIGQELSREFRVVRVERDLFLNDSRARWIKDGGSFSPGFLVNAAAGPSLRWYSLEVPGVYRVELRTSSIDPVGGEPWVLTNPAFVRPGRP